MGDDSDQPQSDKTQVMNVVYGGRWRVDARLGSGGMGSVFRGTDLETNEAVAIKTLSMHLVDQTEFVKRFEREAGLISRLRHPALPGFRALAVQDGMPYFVMTLVEGRTLGELLKEKKPQDPQFLFSLLGQLSEVLMYLHGQGVVHRDLKPDNLMVDAKGQLSLIDFGISAQTNVTRLTLPGLIVGTPLYMAPEAITTGQTTPVSDVYALGMVAFTLLTGAHPFAKEERAGMLTRQVNEVPRSAALINPSVTAPVARVLARALEKSPSARYQSAPEFVAALRGAWGFDADVRTTVIDETTENERPVPHVSPPSVIFSTEELEKTELERTVPRVAPPAALVEDPDQRTAERPVSQVQPPPPPAGLTTPMVIVLLVAMLAVLLLAVVLLR